MRLHVPDLITSSLGIHWNPDGSLETLHVPASVPRSEDTFTDLDPEQAILLEKIIEDASDEVVSYFLPEDVKETREKVRTVANLCIVRALREGAEQSIHKPACVCVDEIMERDAVADKAQQEHELSLTADPAEDDAVAHDPFADDDGELHHDPLEAIEEAEALARAKVERELRTARANAWAAAKLAEEKARREEAAASNTSPSTDTEAVHGVTDPDKKAALASTSEILTILDTTPITFNEQHCAFLLAACQEHVQVPERAYVEHVSELICITPEVAATSQTLITPALPIEKMLSVVNRTGELTIFLGRAASKNIFQRMFAKFVDVVGSMPVEGGLLLQ